MLIGCDRGIAVFEMLFCGSDEIGLFSLVDGRRTLDGNGTGFASDDGRLSTCKDTSISISYKHFAQARHAQESNLLCFVL